MNTLFSFVGPILTGVISPLLGVLKGGIDKADNGVKALATMSDGNPKKSGALAVVLGWLGIDPTAVNNIGSILAKVAGWLQAF